MKYKNRLFTSQLILEFKLKTNPMAIFPEPLEKPENI